MVGFDVLQQQVNLIRRFNSIVQTPDSDITQPRKRDETLLEFIDQNQKAHNDSHSELDIECYEDVLRADLGALVGVHEVNSLPAVVTSLLDERVEWSQRLELLRDQVLFNPGNAVQTAAKQILDLIT